MIFYLTAIERKANPCVNCQKIHLLERAQHAVLDHSKTIVLFNDVIKIEMTNSRVLAPPFVPIQKKFAEPIESNYTLCETHSKWTDCKL